MKEDEILSGLEKLVESLSIQLRYEKGDFAGGYCVLDDKRMMIVNSALSPAMRIKVLAHELAAMNLDDVFVLPALREVIMATVPPRRDQPPESPALPFKTSSREDGIEQPLALES
jgi:hypothetical protein